MANEKQEFVESLGNIVGLKITGAAYSERDGQPIIVFNLINENKTELISYYIPLDLQALKGKPVGNFELKDGEN